ncbi:protein jag [Fusobacterium sp. PH5-44]|uniref:Jag family protein n=1 Tax=unclassified Fusobacterium TaxID=2648384 RepID=UPI003D1AD2B9
MNTVIEIKAMSKDEAIKRALKIADAVEENIVKVIEKKKGKSFLGLFTSEGIYEIEIDKNKKAQKVEPIVSKEELKKEFKGKQEEKLVNESTKPMEKIIKTEVLKESDSDVVNEKRENREFSEDLTDEIKEKSQILLNKMGLNLSVTVSKLYERTYIVNIYGEDNGIIIGKKGKTLNSFEYFLNSLFKRCRIEVDVEGFKEKRYETLRDLGRKMAEKVVKTRRTLRLNPMPARERKIIHEIINTYEELNTFSEGKDPKRYIVIKYKR